METALFIFLALSGTTSKCSPLEAGLALQMAAREFVQDPNPAPTKWDDFAISDAVYVRDLATPAQRLRRQADELERRSARARFVRHAASRCRGKESTGGVIFFHAAERP